MSGAVGALGERGDKIFTAHPVAALESIRASGVPHKILHLVRHAQGTHNLAVLEAGGSDGGSGDKEAEYKNWKWADARLTPLGESQARALRPKLEGVHLDVVLVSCLSRAIQTALLAIPPGPPFVVDELIRERNGTHPCDQRRSRTALAADFPSLDLRALAAEEDDSWTPVREPMPALIARADAWLESVSARPETSIAAVSHNDFLTALLFDSGLRLAEPSLRVKFGNAEHLALVLTWEELPPPRRRGPSLVLGQAATGVYGSHAALDTLITLSGEGGGSAAAAGATEAVGGERG